MEIIPAPATPNVALSRAKSLIEDILTARDLRITGEGRQGWTSDAIAVLADIREALKGESRWTESQRSS